MAITRDVADAIEDAERTLEQWNRVHALLDDGLKWEEIDNGWVPPHNFGTAYAPWCAYMQGRMKNHLRSIVLCYRHGPKPTP